MINANVGKYRHKTHSMAEKAMQKTMPSQSETGHPHSCNKYKTDGQPSLRKTKESTLNNNQFPGVEKCTDQLNASTSRNRWVRRDPPSLSINASVRQKNSNILSNDDPQCDRVKIKDSPSQQSPMPSVPI